MLYTLKSISGSEVLIPSLEQINVSNPMITSDGNRNRYQNNNIKYEKEQVTELKQYARTEPGNSIIILNRNKHN